MRQPGDSTSAHDRRPPSIEEVPVRIHRRVVVVASAVAVVGTAGLSGCGAGGSASPAAAQTTSPGSLPQGGDPVRLDPARFTVDITNQYWPMAPGDRWVYEDTDADGNVQRVEVTVLDRTKTMPNGVEAREVHDQVTTEDGDLVEDTLDWYAQDADGNVWYMGEKTAEYENGEVATTEGSWQAGRDGAQAGILLPASPEPGTGYRQEYLKGEAEDAGFVLSTDEQVEVATGHYDNALLTRDTTALEPDVEELKFYVPDLGPVLTLTVAGGAGREELTDSSRAG
jgi:hypothetical protein